MFTLVAYSQSVDTGGVLTNINALPDQHVRVEGKNIVVPAGMANLVGSLAIGLSIVDARLESPSLRRTLLFNFPGLNKATKPSFPSPMLNAFYNPIPLDEFEPFRAAVAEEATGAEQETVLVWLGDGAQAPVAGDIYTVRATSATTLVPYSWTNAALTFDQTLPAGRYQVVGFKAISPGLLAARMVFVGGTWRPGVIGCDVPMDTPPEIFSRGGLGVYGEFVHDQPPTVDFLSMAADTMEYVYLDLIKVA